MAYGADWLVDGASGLARRFRVSPLVIGLTVVAYGTSAPEIGASVVAVLRESPGLAVGNVVGSNAANLGLILGLTAVLGPFAVNRRGLRREFGFMLGVTCLLWPMAAAGGVSRPVGFVLLALLAAFNVLSIHWSRRDGAEVAGDAAAPGLSKSLATTGLGLLVLLVGADLLVRGASDIARTFGASETTIGLTLVAVGTSLPELAASIAAMRRGENQIAAGNVVGSNLFNVLGALGFAAAVTGVEVETRLLAAEVPGVIVLTLLAGALLFAGPRIGKLKGAALLAAYAGYVTFVLL